MGVVAAAVLLAGVGGACWAAAAGGGDDAAGAKPAPLRIDGLDVPGKGSPGSGSTSDGNAVYQLTGTLPDGPKSAAVYAAAGGPTKAQVQRLAGVLGLSGQVSTDGTSWQVGRIGSGPALLVGRAAPGTWTYTRSGPAAVPGRTDGAGSSTATLLPSPGVSAGTSGGGASDGATDGATAPVSVQRAEAAAAPVFSALDLSGARIDAAQTVGAERLVTAEPVVGGLPTHGWSTTLTIGPDGKPAMASGSLSALTKGATYPVGSAQTALKQLNATSVAHPDHGVASCPVPAPSATPTVPGQDKTLPRSLPCVPGNGHPVQVRGAAFGLSLQFVSGVRTLVPSWLFATAPAGVTTTSVVAEPAVDPSYLRDGEPGSVPPSGPAVPVDPGGPMKPGGPGKTGVPAQPPNPPAPGASQKVKLTGVQATGSTLAVTFYGGLCSTYSASAQESATQVRVTVTAVPKGKQQMCPMIARSFTLKVELRQPLGDRTVVDASDGQLVKGQ